MAWDWWMQQEGFQYNEQMQAEYLQQMDSFVNESKKESKKPRRNRSSQLSNPARPRLQELRNLPQRGLGLRYVSDDRKFEVVKLQPSAPSESPGPAATVVRADPANVLEAQGGSTLPPLDNVGSSVVCCTVEEWVARRFASTEHCAWEETENVMLENGESGTQSEWARRFAQREKQLLVGKGTRGYRRFLRLIPKTQRKTGDPQTPRVAEQCSKRAFDGRLKQWRILLHAFSPRESEDEAEEFDPCPRTPPRDAGTPLGIPPTPPKPTMLFPNSPSSAEKESLKARQEKQSPGALPFSPGPASTQYTLSPESPFPQLPFYTGPTDFTFSPEISTSLSHLAPGFQDLLQKMGENPAFLNGLDLPEIPPPPGLEEMTELLPKDLLEQEAKVMPKDVDCDAALDNANVPDQLRTVFKDAFVSAQASSPDDKELLFHNATRAIIGTLSPDETPTIEVLDALLRFMNELRGSSVV